MADTPGPETTTEGMLDYQCTREQRRVVRNAMGQLKLYGSTTNPPETITVDMTQWATLVRYAYDLDYLCRSERVIGEKK